MRGRRVFGWVLASWIAGVAMPADADRGETMAKLGRLKVAFPEADRGGEMALEVFAETLSRLSASADASGDGIEFTAADGEGDVIVEIPSSGEPEVIARLIQKAGLATGGGPAVEVPPGAEPEAVAALVERAAGTVVLRQHPIRSMLGQELAGRLRLVVAPEIRLDDTGALAALGYLSRLYAKGAPNAEPLRFVEEPGSGARDRRLSISLTDIPLDEALKYIVDLCGLTLRYDPEGSVVVVSTDKRGR